MRYIAALDYEHLDNGMFLTALARSIGRQQNVQPIVVHGDSAYTERIMQAGVMRDEATIRSIKGLNHRLVGLFADEGVSAVGINGHQRKLITTTGSRLSIDTAFFDKLPSGPVLLISTLVWDARRQAPRPVPLPAMVSFLRAQLGAHPVFVFTKAGKDEIIIREQPDSMEWKSMKQEFAEKNLPEEFRNFDEPLYLTTARDFSKIPDDMPSVEIR